MDNFIGISREIVSHWIYQDAEYFKVWFEMLHRARYSKEAASELIEGQLIEIKYSEFVFGRKKWCERIGISEQRMRTLLKKLVENDMIELTAKYNKFSLYRIKNYEKYNHHSNQQETQSDQGIEEDANQQNNRQLTSSQPASNQQLTTKEESKERSKKEKNVLNTIPHLEIINHLNQVTGQRYRTNSKKTQGNINARWNEGYRLDDFKTVIDKKAAEWLNNPNMAQYLRPETLFGNKFENYLNQPLKPVLIKGGQADGRNDTRDASGVIKTHKPGGLTARFAQGV